MLLYAELQLALTFKIRITVGDLKSLEKNTTYSNKVIVAKILYCLAVTPCSLIRALHNGGKITLYRKFAERGVGLEEFRKNTTYCNKVTVAQIPYCLAVTPCSLIRVPPYFSSNFLYRVILPPLHPPPAGRFSRFAVLWFMHMYACCMCRSV